MSTRPLPFVFLILWLLPILLVGCGAHTAREHHGVFSRGAVAADHHLASRAGAEMLAQGGNAVDAAVAASFTLAVVRPYSCGLGGGGFMVIHLPDDPTHGRVSTAINYRETSPVGPDFFETTAKSSTVGGAAVAVPGTISGLLHALDTYGTLDRRDILRPAIRAAQEGFIADAHYAQAAQGLIERFERQPEWKERFPLVWQTYLHEGSVRAGDRIVNPELARALAACLFWGKGSQAEDGLRRAISAAVEADGGLMPLSVLEAYRPVEMEPLRVLVGDFELLCMPPPSSGGTTIAQTLAIMSALGMDPRDPIDTDDERHRFVEALRHAFADRARWLADPAFAPVPVGAMLAPANIARMAALIGERALDPSVYGTHEALPDDAGTSHLSAVDRWGGAVACTETINLEFGSLLGVPAYGIVLNNEMDDFTTVRGRANAFGLNQSDRNLPEVGKRPLSSMSPTIVLEGGRVSVVVGASGGPRIITGTAQVLLASLSGTDAGDAVAGPRIHHQWMPDRVEVEAGSGWGEGLAARGHTVLERPAGSNVQVIRRAGDRWQAASDPRKGGRPAGH
jgi:gamma-glutamyltranspeptidase/glutathione hydrolase